VQLQCGVVRTVAGICDRFRAAARLWKQPHHLTGNAVDEPTDETTQRAELAPHARRGRHWLNLNRRERQELIKQNQRRADKAKDTQRRPGSNTPSPTDADVDAYWDRKRADIAQILHREVITNPDERRMKMEVLASRHAYQRGQNVVEAALWALTAILRYHDSPGSLLRDADACGSRATTRAPRGASHRYRAPRVARPRRRRRRSVRPAIWARALRWCRDLRWRP
jgi:hypothetical protein